MKKASAKVSFLGIGNMGSALLQGALKSGIVKPGNVTCYDLDRKRLNDFARANKVRVASSNANALGRSNFIFLCVKPYQMNGLLLEIRNHLREKQCLISIAAGISTGAIEEILSRKAAVIRVMPNTPALIQSGVSAVTRGKYASMSQLRFAFDFLSAVGDVAVLPEKHFDAVTAVSGSGPAYLFYLAESLERAAESLGLPKPVAELFAKRTLSGAGKMLANSSSPQDLRRNVTSPGGTTESAIRYLENRDWSGIFVEAVRKARDRSRELSSQPH